MTRRTFSLFPIALAAQPNVRVEVIWIEASSIPEEFARESAVFTRAYTSCPGSGVVRTALETGRFPHSLGNSVRMISSIPANITIMTAESGDGEESPFERSIRVPLAIRWPGKLVPRVVSDVLISHVDLLPTLMGLFSGSVVNLQMPPQGRDLSMLIARREGETPDSVYVEGHIGQKDEWRAVIRGFDKIVINLQEEVTHLYNLADDPHEETNLIDSREHELMQDSMLALARRWRRTLGDGVDPSGLRRR